MNFLLEKCTFYPLNEDTISECQNFSCGHNDLDEFFIHDASLYSSQLLGKSYCFRLDSNPTIIVCAFTVSNDSIRVDVLRRYPAVLIGRLGVNTEYKEQKIGSDLIDFIKSWFIDSNNKTGCRFLVVDSYNDQVPISYYQKNKFLFLFSTEELEAQNIGYPQNRNLETRLMYFDLITLRG